MKKKRREIEEREINVRSLILANLMSLILADLRSLILANLYLSTIG